MKDEFKELYTYCDTEESALRRLIDIVKVLREQCPWDKVQTHDSLTTCMVEEAYEVANAIKEKDVPNLREELGDVLLQVVFHGLLSEEENEFTTVDVINDECEKMIRRHPHIFQEENVKSVDKVLEKWENVKSREHGEETVTERLNRVPKIFPSLMKSYKIQSKVAQVGFDFENEQEAIKKIDEEILELKSAIDRGNEAAINEELGDLLFSVVNVARHIGVNPEESLNLSTDKFIRRFSKVEDLAIKEGNSLKDMNVSEMDMLWNLVKDQDNK